VFGPGGLRNPLVIGLPALAVGLMAHAAVSAMGFLAAFVCLVLLVRDPGRHVRAATLALAVCLAFFVASVMGLSGVSQGAAYDPPSYGPVTPGPVPVIPVAVDPPAAAPPPAPQTERSMNDVLLADLYAVSTDAGPVEDPGPAPGPGVSGPVTDAYEVDRLPALENGTQAARVLAWFFPFASVPHPVAENAMLWLHVSADGRVTADGYQLIRSTSQDAGNAAIYTVPYLRYRPAIKNGRAVDVWITQRMVIAP
jgi:hypothetical protein